MAKTKRQNAEKAIRAGYFDKSAFQQKKRLILVLKTGVAGLRFHVDKESGEGKALLAKLTPGTELMLFRDTNNEHDKWAIAVYTKDNKELGYITRFKNESVARLMDTGRKFLAFVDEPPAPPADETESRRTRTFTEGFEIPLSIYMEE